MTKMHALEADSLKNNSAAKTSSAAELADVKVRERAYALPFHLPLLIILSLYCLSLI